MFSSQLFAHLPALVDLLKTKTRQKIPSVSNPACQILHRETEARGRHLSFPAAHTKIPGNSQVLFIFRALSRELLLDRKAQGTEEQQRKGGGCKVTFLKLFRGERGGIQPGLNALSFKGGENQEDREVFVPPSADSDSGISAVYQERICSGTSGNKSTSEALSPPSPRQTQNIPFQRPRTS